MDNRTREFINELTEEIVNVYHITIPFAKLSELKDVVEKMNGTVTEDDSSAYANGRIKKISDDKFEISVSRSQSDERKKFTIAHELGHLFLHMGYQIDEERWNEIGKKEYFRQGTSEGEYQANEFAAAFLMPKKLFLDKIEELSSGDKVNMQEVADYFGVSLAAAKTRGKWIGILVW